MPKYFEKRQPKHSLSGINFLKSVSLHADSVKPRVYQFNQRSRENKSKKPLIATFLMLITTFLSLLLIFCKYFSLNLFSNLPRQKIISQTTNSAELMELPMDQNPQKSLPPCFQDGQSLYQRQTPNNKFGMYMVVDSATLSMEKQITEIANLINSNGGDWGYVLYPLWINNLEEKEWETFFNLAKENHLIPIIQLHPYQYDQDYLFSQLAKTASFLNSFSWPSSCWIVTVFNETNAKDFWGENIDPEGYARVLAKAMEIFKEENENFFILNSGFNSSSRSGPRYLDEEEYLIRMDEAVPGIFEKLDGWASHPYPQPEFSGDFHNPPSWYETRDQISAYKWEMDLLKNYFGVENLPVFLTETGWAHKEGEQPKWQYKSAAITAQYFDDVFQNVWLPDKRVVAIIPFIFNHASFSNFNWMTIEGYCYPQCDVVKKIEKVAGSPI